MLGKTKLGHDVMEAFENLRKTTELLQDDYLQKYLHRNPRYTESKRLNRYERKVYSQNGEDGIIEEIFNRIGSENKTFVEFGVGDGTENNSVYLLIKGWKGFWLEGSQKFTEAIHKTFASVISSGQLRVKNTFITRDNIVSTFQELGIPKEPDIISIDIDGNDYWIFKQLSDYRPRLFILEYNAHFPPPISWVKAHDPKSTWTGNSIYGASLKSFTDLATEKGYTLVACDFAGVNAFFVRNDLVQDRFPTENTAEYHYENIKVFLARRAGHPRGFSPFERV